MDLEVTDEAEAGLVHDMMEEALERYHSFCVLDCNCFATSIQRSPAKWLFHKPLDGLF